MRANEQISRKGKILIGVYSSSAGISMTALAIVAVLEVFMLVYSVLNAPMYGDYLWHYRAFYIALLAVALIYIALNAFVKRDIARRYKVLNVANPLYAVFFFGWALGITFFDSIIWGTADTMVFMTFSLVVPLSFFLFPWAYVAIVVVADALMMYLTVTVTGTVASLINLSIFCIFQIVLGFSFLRMRLKLAERIVQEQENADIDVLTGFANRRVYEQDMKKLSSYPGRGRMAYISIDVNGLKEIKKLYRVGGDEFVALVTANAEELEKLFRTFARCTQAWSKRNDLALSTAYGFVCYSEYPDSDSAVLARVADERMYAAKARYYQMNGKDRRRHVDDAPQTRARQ